jgi:hypothetical protein
MWTRRAFLRSAGAGFAASLAAGRAEALDRAGLIFASSIEKKHGGYGAALISDRGAVLSTIDLPDRGHDVTFSPRDGRGVVFARQPGTFAVVFDPAGRESPVTIMSAEGRHFFGHGAFSPDGKLLYATENDFENARSVVGMFDVAGGYVRVGEIDAHGIGAHEMLLTADGTTLVVANGGIETHPDFGRAELNLATMDPSLSFIDARNGGLIGQLRLDAGLHQLSIRHLAFDAKGRVWFGCQYRGAAEDRPQLVGYATRDGDIRLIELAGETLRGLRNYVGSVAVSRDGATIAVSSPEGNAIVAIDAASAKAVAVLGLESGCGIAPDGDGFVASSGQGEMTGFAGSAVEARRFEFGFDNHLRRAVQASPGA